MSTNAGESLTSAEADVTVVRRVVEALRSLPADGVDAGDVPAVLRQIEQAACRLLGADQVVFSGRVRGTAADDAPIGPAATDAPASPSPTSPRPASPPR